MKALIGATLLYLLADASTDLIPSIGPFAQLGAVGVLGWVSASLLAELRASRADSTKQREEQSAALEAMLKRWDGWEDTRHADNAALQATLRETARTTDNTLREITKNCAQAQAARDAKS